MTYHRTPRESRTSAEGAKAKSEKCRKITVYVFCIAVIILMVWLLHVNA